jgi:hypothetical protein
MSKRKSVAGLVVGGFAALVGALVMAPTPAAANPDYLAALEARYPTSTLPDDMLAIAGSKCYVCHNSFVFFGDWNCYRKDLIGRLAAGRTIQEALADIENWDSDGDGTDNRSEVLLAREPGVVGYNPGLVGPIGRDPCLTETVDGVPGSTLGVTGRNETPAPGACCTGVACTVLFQINCAAPVAGLGRSFKGPGAACNAPGNATTPCCKADFNQDGTRAPADIFAYLNAYFSLDPLTIPATDTTGDGVKAPSDIFGFLNLYFAGGCG